MQKFINAIPVIIAGSLLFVVAGQYGDARTELHGARASYEVQQVCDQSRTVVIDTGEEQACGELQDKYSVEYLCSDYTPQAHCWVEVK